MSNKIGVIVSLGYGAGWSTWGDRKSAIDQELAKAIDDGVEFSVISAIAEKNWPSQYQGGLDQCVVEWLDVGTVFKISEYDGSESIEFNYGSDWMVAL